MMREVCRTPEYTEYQSETAIVRFQLGKRSEEERMAILSESAKELWRALQKTEAAKGKTLIVDDDGRIRSVRRDYSGDCVQ